MASIADPWPMWLFDICHNLPHLRELVWYIGSDSFYIITSNGGSITAIDGWELCKRPPLCSYRIYLVHTRHRNQFYHVLNIGSNQLCGSMSLQGIVCSLTDHLAFLPIRNFQIKSCLFHSIRMHLYVVFGMALDRTGRCWWLCRRTFTKHQPNWLLQGSY